MALLLEAENTRLHRRLVELARALAAATGAAQAQLELEIARLQEHLAARTRALFGPSSERRTEGGRDDAPSAASELGAASYCAAILVLMAVVSGAQDRRAEGCTAHSQGAAQDPKLTAWVCYVG